MFGDLSSSPTPYQPQSSSPLAHASSSQARRAGQYKSRVRTTATRRTSASFGASPEATEKALMRERLLAKCEAQRKRDRARAYAHSFSSDGEMSSDGADVPMDAAYDDEDDERDDVLVDRILATEARRRRHTMNVSFDCEVGSSPGVPEDVLEEYFNTEEPPDEDAEFAAMYEDYIQELQSINPTALEESEDPDAQMSDDFLPPPVTPQNKNRRYTRPIPVPRISDILSQCPKCSLPWTVQDLPAGRHTCARCNLTLPPEAVSHAWHSDHGHELASKHSLLAAALPDGPILVCGAEECDWCFDL